MLSMCGNRCDLCPRYIATKLGSPSELKRVAGLWHMLGWRDRVVTSGEISCAGCGSSRSCAYEIRVCADKQGVEHCGDCGQFPCGTVTEAFEKSARYEEICRERCEGGDYAQLKRAFFEKRKNLESAGKDRQ